MHRGGCRKIVTCTFRERSSVLQTRNMLKLGFCAAKLCGQCGMLGALNRALVAQGIMLDHWMQYADNAQSVSSMGVAKKYEARLTRFRPSTTKAFLQLSSDVHSARVAHRQAVRSWAVYVSSQSRCQAVKKAEYPVLPVKPRYWIFSAAFL